MKRPLRFSVLGFRELCQECKLAYSQVTHALLLEQITDLAMKSILDLARSRKISI
jgi:hypothetical protein